MRATATKQTTQFKIEKGIPLPALGKQSPAKQSPKAKKYRFDEMEKTDSFLIGRDKKLVTNVRSAASVFKRKHPEQRFRILKDKGGFRCWRIK